MVETGDMIPTGRGWMAKSEENHAHQCLQGRLMHVALETALLRQIPRQKCRVIDCERDQCRAVPFMAVPGLKIRATYAAVQCGCGAVCAFAPASYFLQRMIS